MHRIFNKVDLIMILVVHPLDPSTKALIRVGNYIKDSFPNDVQIFNVHPNEESRFVCYETIKKCTPEDIILFLGHGSSYALYGSKGEMYDRADFVSYDVLKEYPERYYYNEHFINKENWEILKDKRLICVSCMSNVFGKTLFEKGVVRSMIGFGDIPSSTGEFLEKGITANSHLIAWMKGEINWIVKRSVVYSHMMNYSFSMTGDLMKFIIQQRIAMHLHSKNRFRFVLANQLALIKDDLLVKERK